MIVTLAEIPDTGLKLDIALINKDFPRLDERYEFQCLTSQILLKRTQDQVAMIADYQVELTAPCDLCLETATIKIDNHFEIDLIRAGSQAEAKEDQEINLESASIDYYNGSELYLETYIEDQLLLDLPFQTLCKDDCQGLCPHCGVNLNQNSCQCHKEHSTSPFAVLKDLIKPEQS